MALIDLAPPSVEPVDLAYAKQFLRVDGNDEDALIADLISTTRHQVESMISRTMVMRSFRYLGVIPNAYCLSLPRPPLLVVTSVSLYDAHGQSVIVPATDYIVNARRDPGEFSLKHGKTWTDYIDIPTEIEIEFSAGYGASADDVPLPLKQALLLLLAQHYEYRDSTDQPPIPMMVDALLMSYRWVRL